MKVKILILSAVGLLFFSCKSEKTGESEKVAVEKVSPQTTDTQAEPETAARESTETTAYIKQFARDSDGFKVGFTHINFLTGDEAIEAAKKEGEAMEDVEPDGSIIYSVPNDYYITITDSGLYNMKLARDVKLTAWAYSDEEGMYQKEFSDAKAYDKFYRDRGGLEGVPFIFELNNGEVTSISEQYVP